MAIIGYARVSSTGQKLDVQLEKLQAAKVDKLYQEKITGTNSSRPEFKACLDYVREGDTLMVTKLDRLARSTLDLCSIAKRLETKGVMLKVIDQNLDTTTSTGRLMFNMLATIAQFETEIRAERQMDGIKKAKANGVRFGKSKRLTNQQAIELKAKRDRGLLIKDLMREYQIGRRTVYDYLEQQKSAYV